MFLKYDFPGSSDGKASVYNVRDLGLIPGLGRFPGEGNGNPLQYSCLENPVDRRAWCRLLYMGSQRVGHNWETSLSLSHLLLGFPGGASGKELTCQFRRCNGCRFDPWVRKIRWRRAWQPTPVLLPGESHEQRSLAGYSPWGHKQSDMTEWLSTHIFYYT